MSTNKRKIFVFKCMINGYNYIPMLGWVIQLSVNYMPVLKNNKQQNQKYPVTGKMSCLAVRFLFFMNLIYEIQTGGGKQRYVFSSILFFSVKNGIFFFLYIIQNFMKVICFLYPTIYTMLCCQFSYTFILIYP